MKPLRTLIVDDSVSYRMFLAKALDAIGGCEVIGEARHGYEALEQIEALQPDLVTLDIEMPRMNGMEVLEEIRTRGLTPKTLVISSVANQGSQTAIDALRLGAFDVISKPIVSDIDAARESVLNDMTRIIRGLGQNEKQAGSVSAPRRTVARAARKSAARRPEIVLIGISTGGPVALAEVLTELPSTLEVPVVIVQHMPAQFTESLAQSLDAKCALKIKEAEDGEPLLPGHVYLAPGGQQLKIKGSRSNARACVTDDPPELFCRPAYNYLLESVPPIFGDAVLAFVMTGLGCDGVRGLTMIRDAGGTVVAQDQRTSTVWGMPGAAVQAGIVDHQVPLDQVSVEITRALGK